MPKVSCFGVWTAGMARSSLSNKTIWDFREGAIRNLMSILWEVVKMPLYVSRHMSLDTYGSQMQERVPSSCHRNSAHSSFAVGSSAQKSISATMWRCYNTKSAQHCQEVVKNDNKSNCWAYTSDELLESISNASLNCTRNTVDSSRI